MAQKYEKIKFKRDFLMQNKTFAPVITNIERSINNQNAEIIIFLPDCTMEDLVNLFKYMTIKSNPPKLKEVGLTIKYLKG